MAASGLDSIGPGSLGVGGCCSEGGSVVDAGKFSGLSPTPLLNFEERGSLGSFIFECPVVRKGSAFGCQVTEVFPLSLNHMRF